MNSQLRFASSREFWAGVGATIIVGIFVAVGVPNLMRSRMSLHEFKRAPAASAAYIAGYSDTDMVAQLSSISAAAEERKMIRTASMDMLVKSPKETSQRIRVLAEQVGGFLVSSEIFGGADDGSASLTVRIPINQFEQFRAQISKFGLKVESERLETQDVTKQYVDLAARLRNLHAQETQYLGILKQARTVKDTVEVSDKLNNVRLQIDQQQAEFDTLSKQVDTVALTVSLHAEAEAQVFGLHWRPLYQLKLAVREGIDGIGDYAASMTWFLFYIPAILLWLATILIGAAVAWRILRWAWKTLFVRYRKADSHP